MERLSRKINLLNRSEVKNSRQVMSNFRENRVDDKKLRKSSLQTKTLNRINTLTTKISTSFVSITGSDKNKLEFPVKINRKNKVIREKLRALFVETIK